MRFQNIKCQNIAKAFLGNKSYCYLQISIYITTPELLEHRTQPIGNKYVWQLVDFSCQPYSKITNRTKVKNQKTPADDKLNIMACGRVTLTIFVFSCAFLLINGQKNAVTNLDETNWTQMLQGEWMVEFYAPWCPACKALESIWKDFGSWSDDLNIKVAKVDVTLSPGLSGRFMVTALPTIFHVLNGEFRQYKGSRDKDSFISFIEEKKWQNVEPVPSWKSPASIQMSVVSGFFRLSQILRQIHTQLMEDFGLPTWGSYLIFAIGTIFLGALLGLLLVCCIDLIYPPKSTGKVNDVKSKVDKKSDKSSGDELADEDIKDDLIDDQEEEENNSQSETEVKEKSESNPNSPVVKKRKPRKE